LIKICITFKTFHNTTVWSEEKTLKNLWCCIHFLPEESVVFHTLLPEVLAVVSLIKVELNNILVVALQKNEHLNDEDTSTYCMLLNESAYWSSWPVCLFLFSQFSLPAVLGSGIRWFFDPQIRDPGFASETGFSRFWIPKSVFGGLCVNFFSKTYLNSLLTGSN
jgi:hypothetical protein